MVHCKAKFGYQKSSVKCTCEQYTHVDRLSTVNPTAVLTAILQMDRC